MKVVFRCHLHSFPQPHAGSPLGGVPDLFRPGLPYRERILIRRRTSKATGEVYYLENDPPPKPDEMMDPWPFLRRNDDTEEATKAHLETYRKEKGPLKSHYEAKDLLTVLDASRPMGEVTAEILEALGHPERPGYYASCQRV